MWLEQHAIKRPNIVIKYKIKYYIKYESLQVPNVLKYLKSDYKKARQGIFTRACIDRTRGNGFKPKEVRY